jgi:predicted nucleic acid-binding protein
LIRQGNFGVSGQVLPEFYAVTTRKLAKPLPPAVAARWVARLSTAAFVPTDASLVKAAIDGSIRWRISYWDAAFVAAAEALGARTLYCEDISHGQVYGSVTVRNPFLDAG